MSIKHKDIEVPEGDPFKYCKLGREKYAKVLTGILSTYADGFVLAVNNEWGTGKTTFVKMWQQHLKNKSFEVRYFNAWENDYDSNPLASLIYELKNPLDKIDSNSFNKVLNAASIVGKNVIPWAIKAAGKHIMGEKTTSEIFDKLADAGGEVFKEQVKEYEKKKKGLLEFRESIESYLNENSNDKPLIFIIDELDRCRPDYAVEVLELIKHFFSVDGIVFVLSIDKEQLGNAVRGFYGSEKIDADEYLRRFIDLEFIIPPPKTSDFCTFLYDKLKFDEFLKSGQRRSSKDSLNQQDKKIFLDFSTILFEKSNLTLRQQEKVYTHARVVLNLQPVDTYLFPEIYIFLVFLRFFNYDLFKKIKENKLEPQELVENIIEYCLDLIKVDNSEILSMLALLANMYNNSYHILDGSNIDRDQFCRLSKLSTLPPSTNHYLYEKLSTELTKLKDSYLRNANIDYLLDVIDLTSNANI